MLLILVMINSTYLYLFFSSLAIFALAYFLFIFKSTKDHSSNKLLLRKLLESLDLELPEELKRLENSSTDPQKF